jgi:hypothetical protein
MSIPTRTRRQVIAGTALASLVLVAALAFVFYNMHSVYEPDATIEASEVPEPVMAAFLGNVPNPGDVTWEFEQDLYAAVFEDPNGRLVEHYYTPQGELTRTEVAIDFEDLPPAAQDYLASKEGQKVTEQERVENAGGEVVYEVEVVTALSEWDITFDAAGRPLETERDGSVLE